MFEVKMRSRTFIVLTAVVLLLTAAVPLFAMQDAPQDAAPDPIEHLHLSPEQRQRIRIILEDNKNERQATNRRLREANVALDQALDAAPLNEAVIEQRLNELATAQAAQLRMRIQTEIKVRRVLRPEQLAILRSLHLQLRDVMGDRRPARNALRPNRRNIRQP